MTDVHADGTYTVYFPGDGEVVEHIEASRIRPVDNNRSIRRDSIIKAEWYFRGDRDVGAGNWKIERIKGNTYECSRVTGDGPVVLEDFDIGYVIRCYRDGVELQRERGPL